ncbi:MAG: hypothetical protein LC737_11635, partial [Chloroflexi bacterium]|nr:hypothetical protein [Chloroflexota bacterium]
MLLAIQFPLADSRSFIDASVRTRKPIWPHPDPDSEFIHFFGSIRERPAGGIMGWGSENENFVCEANRALSFQRSPSFVDPQTGYRLILRRAFERFFFDGTAVGKFEVGIASKTRSTVEVPPAQIKAVLKHFATLPIAIRNPQGEATTRELADGGEPLANLYLAATRYSKSKVNRVAWHVQSGRPLLFLESQASEHVTVPQGAREVDLPASYGLRLHHHAVMYKGRRLHMWQLRMGDNCDHAQARALRLYLLRLHSEHECLRLVLR